MFFSNYSAELDTSYENSYYLEMIGRPVKFQGFNTTWFPDVVIHDKNFFIINKNPKAIPSLRVFFDLQYTSLTVYVEVTKVSKMNRVGF